MDTYSLWPKCIVCGHDTRTISDNRCGPCERAYTALIAQSTHDLWVMGNRLMMEHPR